MYPKQIYDLKQRKIKIRQWKKDDVKIEKRLKKDWEKAGGKKSG